MSTDCSSRQTVRPYTLNSLESSTATNNIAAEKLKITKNNTKNQPLPNMKNDLRINSAQNNIDNVFNSNVNSDNGDKRSASAYIN